MTNYTSLCLSSYGKLASVTARWLVPLARLDIALIQARDEGQQYSQSRCRGKPRAGCRDNSDGDEEWDRGVMDVKSGGRYER
jgi:hypothetical protein